VWANIHPISAHNLVTTLKVLLSIFLQHLNCKQVTIWFQNRRARARREKKAGKSGMRTVTSSIHNPGRRVIEERSNDRNLPNDVTSLAHGVGLTTQLQQYDVTHQKSPQRALVYYRHVGKTALRVMQLQDAQAVGVQGHTVGLTALADRQYIQSRLNYFMILGLLPPSVFMSDFWKRFYPIVTLPSVNIESSPVWDTSRI